MARHKTPQSIIDQRNDYVAFKGLFFNLVQKFQYIHKKYPLTYTRVTEKIATRNIVLDLYKEILIILERIDNELMSLQELEKDEKKYWRIGKIGPNSKLGKVIFEQLKLKELLTIDTKTLFHWIFILDEVLGKDVFPKAITAFRNIFIVHFPEKVHQNKKVKKLMPTIMFSQHGHQLVFIPFFGIRNFSGFRTLENQVKQYIPSVQTETNYHEKVRIIWENLDKLPLSISGGNQQSHNHFFNRLSQYGSRSTSLLEIVKSLTNVWDKTVKELFK